jgi:hypothetical protein
VPPSVYKEKEAEATLGIPACVAKQVTKPVRSRPVGERGESVRNEEAPAQVPHLA